MDVGECNIGPLDVGLRGGGGGGGEDDQAREREETRDQCGALTKREQLGRADQASAGQGRPSG